MTTLEQRAAYIDGLVALAELLREHPELPLPMDGSTLDFGPVPITIYLHRPEQSAEALDPYLGPAQHEVTGVRRSGAIAGLQVQVFRFHPAPDAEAAATETVTA